MEDFIVLENVSFKYQQNTNEYQSAIDNISLNIKRGSHVAVLGRNGSGKSSLALLIAGLETPSKGKITVSGLEHDGDKVSYEIRRRCGLVFQNPDNQIIGTTVEEDVAFGPENLGIPREEMCIRVDNALKLVGLDDKKKSEPHLLSGGQKQKLAIAGVLAMEPDCLILDEATSMLDPDSRRDFMSLVMKLKSQKDITIINITHDMEEALLAEYIFIMSEGRIVGQGTPGDIFSRMKFVRSHGLDVPVHMEVLQWISELIGEGEISPLSVDPDYAAKEIIKICNGYFSNHSFNDIGEKISDINNSDEKLKLRFSENISVSISENISVNESMNGSMYSSESESVYKSESKSGNKSEKESRNKSEEKSGNTSDNEPVIKVENLDYTYSQETIFADNALKNINLEIQKGGLFGIIGHTGSGKSTLVQHFNALIKPQKGKVLVMGFDTSKKEGIKNIRKNAGLLFQYPEHQLFEETVAKDIAFGPKNMGKKEEEISLAVSKAARIVGLEEDLLDKSPFELSGGQKRRVAIAGVLAMEPEILILDEPAAGLDPEGREDILSFVKELSEKGVTVVLVSHNMDDIARLAQRVLVLNDGEIMACDTPAEIFSKKENMENFGISLPSVTEFMELVKTYIPGLNVTKSFAPREAALEIIESVCRERG